MAEFLNQVGPTRITKKGSGAGFDAMGKPIPAYRKEAGDRTCKAMGITDPEIRWSVVAMMSEQLARDNPYGALEAGMKYLDLTGTYRLMAVLLTAKKEKK